MHDLSQNYGNNLSIPTNSFTREKQSQVVENYFNPNKGSLYNEEFNNREPKPQQSEQNDKTMISNEELAELRGYKERIAKLEEKTRMNNNQPQQNQVPQQNETPANSNEDDAFNKLMNDFLKTDSSQSVPNNTNQTNDTQQPQTPQPGQDAGSVQAPENTQAFQEFSTVAKNAGHDPQEVLKFANQLTNEDIVSLYATYKQSVAQNEASPNVSEMPKNTNIRGSVIPSSGRRHPIFG